MRWEGREPFHSDAIMTLGKNKAASCLLLNVAKVSINSTKDLLNMQTCHGILLCLHLLIVTSHFSHLGVAFDSFRYLPAARTVFV